MRWRPGALAGVTNPLTQQQGFELLSGFESSADCVLARPGQISDGLVRFLRNRDRRQIPCSGEMGERKRFAPIRFNSVPRLARDHCGRNDLTSIAATTQLPSQT